MLKTTIVVGAIATMLVILLFAQGMRASEQSGDPTAAFERAIARPNADPHAGLLYGRVTTDDGNVYEGRLPGRPSADGDGRHPIRSAPHGTTGLRPR